MKECFIITADVCFYYASVILPDILLMFSMSILIMTVPHQCLHFTNEKLKVKGNEYN